jgi:hypothetical protein
MVTSHILSFVLSVSMQAPVEGESQPAVDNGWDEGDSTAAPVPVAEPPAPAAVSTTPAPPTEADDERLWRLRQHNRFRGMMISGFTILGAVYGGSVLIGALAIDLGNDNDNDRQRRYGRRMFIPFGGPFAAAPVSRSATLGVLTVAAGAGQLLGLSLGIAGAVKLREFPNPDARRFAFGVAPTADGAQVGLSGRF